MWQPRYSGYEHIKCGRKRTYTFHGEEKTYKKRILRKSTFVSHNYMTTYLRDGTGQDFLDPTRPVNFKIYAG